MTDFNELAGTNNHAGVVISQHEAVEILASFHRQVIVTAPNMLADYNQTFVTTCNGDYCDYNLPGSQKFPLRSPKQIMVFAPDFTSVAPEYGNNVYPPLLGLAYESPGRASTSTSGLVSPRYTFGTDNQQPVTSEQERRLKILRSLNWKELAHIKKEIKEGRIKDNYTGVNTELLIKSLTELGWRSSSGQPKFKLSASNLIDQLEAYRTASNVLLKNANLPLVT